jgi:hypothetical protein
LARQGLGAPILILPVRIKRRDVKFDARGLV